MSAWFSEGLIERLGWTLIHFLWQGTAIGLLAALALSLWRSSAPLRHGVAALGLLGCALLPIGTFFLLGHHPVVVSEPIAPAAATPRVPVRVVTGEAIDPLLEAAELKASAEAAARGPAWMPWLVAGWSVGVLVLSLQLAVGWWRIHRLKRGALPLEDEEWIRRLLRLQSALGVKQTVRIMRSALVIVPQVVGWLRPVIFLPARVLTGLTPEQIDLLLAHELAHIRRHDYLVNVLQSLVEVALFYHPVVWWLSAQIRREREICCDELVLQMGSDRASYAQMLVELSALNLSGDRLAVPAQGGKLRERIERLLGVTPGRGGRARLAGLAILLLLVVGLGLVVVKKMAQRDTGPQVVGRTVDAAGQPLAGITVYDPVTKEKAMSDRSGIFVLPWPQADKKCHGLLVAVGSDAIGWKHKHLKPRTDGNTKPQVTLKLEKLSESLRGRVTDEKGAALAGALVQVERLEIPSGDTVAQPIGGLPEHPLWSRLRTTTDENGEYVLPVPAASKVRLEVSRKDRAFVYRWDVQPGKVEEFVLPPGGSITGRATNRANGAPIAGQVVRAQYIEELNPAKRNYVLPQEMLAMTDDQGRYHFDNVRLGYFRVMLDRSSTATPKNDLVPDQPVKVEVTAGQAAHADIFALAGVKVSGRVVSQDTGTPLEKEMSVSFALKTTEQTGPGSWRNYQNFWTKKDGSFETYLLPGVYEFWAYAGDEKSPRTEVTVQAGEPPSPVEVVMLSGLAEIKLKIRTSDGKGVLGNSDVRLWKAGERNEIYSTKNGNEFTFNYLRAGEKVRVFADAKGYAFWVSPELIVGQTPKLIEVTLEPVAQTSLTGTVMNGLTRQPLAGARIATWKEAQGITWREFDETKTDAQGVFRIDGLRLGERISVQVMVQDPSGASYSSATVVGDRMGAYRNYSNDVPKFEVTSLDPIQLPPVEVSMRASASWPPFIEPKLPVVPNKALPPKNDPILDEGPRGGVGVLINESGGGVIINSVNPNGSAAKAGILSGDIIEEVDGRKMRTALEAKAAIRGEPGTKVSLRVRSGQAGESRLLELRRLEIPKLGGFYPTSPDSRKEADLEALSKITLPANPTEQQARKYISDIVVASQNQNSFSSSDPQVEMLTRLGREHLDLLLENTANTLASMYTISAVKKLATEEDRDFVISHFGKSPRLIEVIRERQWTQAAKGEITKYLQTRPPGLAMDIVLALASLQDPATYDDLSYGFSHAWGQSGEGFRVLQALPGFDLKKAVNEAWQVRLSRPQYGPNGNLEDYTVATLAARYGNREALDYLFKVLAANVDIPAYAPNVRDSILLATNAPISTNADLQRWYEQNGSKLRYDETAQRFVVD